MHTLSSYRDGSLGTLAAIRDGSLGTLSSYRDGSLGTTCSACSMGATEEPSSSAFDTKKIGMIAGAAVAVGILGYFLLVKR